MSNGGGEESKRGFAYQRSNLDHARKIFSKGLIGFLIVGLIFLIFNGGRLFFGNSNDSKLQGHVSLTSYTRHNGNNRHVLVSHLVSNGESESVVSNMKNFFNKMYTGEVMIGPSEEGQIFPHIVFDTGSADLWVMSEAEKGKNLPDKKYLHYFDTSVASFDSSKSDSWSITYGTGTASGKSGYDSVTIGTMTANKQIFAVATKIEDMSISEYEPQDGICGFARKSASNLKDGTPIMETLHEEGSNENGYFGFYLSQHGDSGSKLLIGDAAIDNNYFEGELKWINVNDNSGYQVPGLWTVLVDEIEISVSGNGKNKDKDSKIVESQYAIVDTGTTYIGIPSDHYTDVMKWITKDRSDCVKESSSSSSIYLCTDTMNPYKNLPNLHLLVQDSDGETIKLTLTPKQYVDDDGQLGFMSLSLTVWILGDTFLKNYYSVFDDSNSRIGFARSKSHDGQMSALMKSILIIAIIVVSILLILSCLRWYIVRKQSRYFINVSQSQAAQHLNNSVDVPHAVENVENIQNIQNFEN